MVKYPVLFTVIQSLSPIPETEWKQLESISAIKMVPKNTQLLRIGEVASHLGLLVTGSVRMYYLDDEGKEFNHAFMFEGSVFAGYPSLVSGMPSKFVIETMEDTTYLSIPYKEFLPFYDRHSAWDRLGRKALEMNYLDKLEREAILLTGDAYSKYERAIKLYPQLEERIPQYHIASFIGVTPSALNRILKKHKN